MSCCPRRKITKAAEVFIYRAELECGHVTEISLARGEPPPAETCCQACRAAAVGEAIAAAVHSAVGVPEGVKPD